MNHLINPRAVDEIVIHLAPIGPKASDIAAFVTEIKMGFKGVVKKDPVGHLVVQRDVKGHGFVQFVQVFAVGVLISVPVG